MSSDPPSWLALDHVLVLKEVRPQDIYSGTVVGSSGDYKLHTSILSEHSVVSHHFVA